MPDTDTLIIERKNRYKSNNKKSRRLAVTLQPVNSKAAVPQVKENINKIVEDEMRRNGYRRQDDPLIQEIRKLAKNYQAKVKRY
ncbi:hypothetical protein BIV60_11440 [Bacillus sp. MUM 116]|uniref:hypothetical protein n=1 Tax=Bacillus sp. MUM 116 TaxID=1678002 RepID=UPI0008F5B2B3|nr:hypothetical protein [Bacillus sp. MUM 116]OIK14573.1 hypothetical protein BIV60_11440 [Bacillus sp. MUM 116]